MNTTTTPLDTEQAATPLHRLDLEHAAIGAAVGAGCRPCLTHHVGVARDEGMDDQRLREVLQTADRALIATRDDFGRHATTLLGDDPATDLRREPGGDLATVLVGLGVAIGDNAVSIAEAHLGHLETLGVTERDRRRAVNLARAVQRTAGELTANALVAREDAGSQTVPESVVAEAIGGSEAAGCCGGPAPAAGPSTNGASAGGCCG